MVCLGRGASLCDERGDFSILRAPEHGVLHGVVVEHLQTFLWELDRQGDEYRLVAADRKEDAPVAFGGQVDTDAGTGGSKSSAGARQSQTPASNSLHPHSVSANVGRISAAWLAARTGPLFWL